MPQHPSLCQSSDTNLPKHVKTCHKSATTCHKSPYFAINLPHSHKMPHITTIMIQNILLCYISATLPQKSPTNMPQIFHKMPHFATNATNLTQICPKSSTLCHTCLTVLQISVYKNITADFILVSCVFS